MGRIQLQQSGFIRRLTVALFLSLAPANVFAEPVSWLMKISEAAARVNFIGIFAYIHDGEIEAMEVARRIKNGLMQERIYSLNGEPREIIRGRDKIWCYLPDENVVVNHYRQTLKSGFPRILAEDLSLLSEYYHFEEIGGYRIADRETMQIDVIPNDDYRYGYSLWADKETGLLLRSDLIDANGEIVEQYQFIDIEINAEIDDAQLEPVSSIDSLKLFDDSTPMPEPAEPSDWTVTNLPVGYQLSKRIKRMSPLDTDEIEHLVYTDGLSSVSVFIKKANEKQSKLTGLSRMGAVHAFRSKISDYRVTVMGEVPADMVKLLAQGIRRNTQ